jgi:transposase
LKTDDRDCAALVWLLRQGAGRPAEPQIVESMLGTVRHRRQLVDARRVLQQRLQDQLDTLCPDLSAPTAHGRALKLEGVTGQAVLACAVAFAGRAPSTRSLLARAQGRMTCATAAFWAQRWKRLLAPPPDAELRAALEQTPGQILTTLPGVAIVRAAAFSAYTLPIERWPTPEHLYSATGLAPATYHSSTITRRGKISRQGLAEHRDALMGITWGLSLYSTAFKARDAELKARGFRPIQARVALARHACRLCWRLLHSQQPRRRSAIRSRSAARAVTALQLCRTTAHPSLPPARAAATHTYT